MSNVIDFTAHRLKEKRKATTIVELSAKATDFLLGDWEKMARNNRLNDYFRNSLTHAIDPNSKVNYMSDLNEVAALELNLDLYPMVFFPGTLQPKQIGWLVQFHLGKEKISTPELATEAYARCFAILLYLKLKRDCIEAGLL